MNRLRNPVALLAAALPLLAFGVHLALRQHAARSGSALSDGAPTEAARLDTPTNVVVEDAASSPARDPIPCPALPAVTARVQAALTAKLPVHLLRCVPGFFPRAGFFTVSTVDDQLEQVILDAADPALPPRRADPRPAAGVVPRDITTVDLDGDGSDEVLIGVSVDRRGIAESLLYVYRIEGARLAESLYLQTSFDNQGSLDDDGERRDRYEARWTLAEPATDGARVLTIEGSLREGRADPDWVVGHASFRWRDGRVSRDAADAAVALPGSRD